jgi:hypothetical protein
VETVRSYNDYKANPNKDNRPELIDYLEIVRQVEPPEGKQDEFNHMWEDIFGILRPSLLSF